MAKEIFMQKMSTSMTEGEVVSILKKEGEKVNQGDMILEVMGDKATMEMDCFDSGIIGKWFVEEGDVVPVETVIGVILDEGEELPEKYKNYKIEKK